MFRSVLLVLLVLNLGLVKPFPTKPPNGGKNWVVLVAGSKGWDNYRHQANLCHAYQVVHQHGIPDSQIVVMMYDDIAFNSKNPTPGIIINQPNGRNVYTGVPKDYTGNNVTPQKFLAVLKGDARTAGGKVLNSGPKDHVFVYYTDHGGSGLVAFPNGYLYAKDLHDTIDYMHRNHKYAKMVFYIDACHSGSMMTSLPSNIEVYATTSANPSESSYARYKDSLRKTYLGSWYGTSWMEDSDANDLKKKSLQDQYRTVKANVQNSHVMEYGSRGVSNMMLSQFQGNDNVNKVDSELTLQPIPEHDQIPSPEVPLAILKMKLLDSENITYQRALLKEIDTHFKIRELMAETMRRIIESVTGDELEVEKILNSQAELTQHQCYKAAVDHFYITCFNWNEPEYEYALTHLYKLLNLCEEGYPAERIQLAMDQECGNIQ